MRIWSVCLGFALVVGLIITGAAISEPPEGGKGKDGPPPRGKGKDKDGPPGRGGPGGAPGGPGGLERALDDLDLSETKKEKAGVILKAHHEKMPQLMDEAHADLLK